MGGRDDEKMFATASGKRMAVGLPRSEAERNQKTVGVTSGFQRRREKIQGFVGYSDLC